MAAFTKRTLWRRIVDADKAGAARAGTLRGHYKLRTARELYPFYRQSLAEEETARGHALPSGKPGKRTRRKISPARRTPSARKRGDRGMAATGFNKQRKSPYKTRPLHSRTEHAKIARDLRFAKAAAKQAAALKAARALVAQAKREAAAKKREAVRMRAKKAREAEAARKKKVAAAERAKKAKVAAAERAKRAKVAAAAKKVKAAAKKKVKAAAKKKAAPKVKAAGSHTKTRRTGKAGGSRSSTKTGRKRSPKAPAA